MAFEIIDPINDILGNSNQNMTNGIPQYQDMFIFAELIGKSRGRTVLETTSSGAYTLSKDGNNGDVAVNFIGNNQNTDKTDPNYLNFTTNWYDGSTEKDHQTEGFGITNIKVSINSSFIPQVNIQFIDLRGQAFFNQTKSPYRMLFDFPPPVFHLTLKGYYGKALSYQLHLVKYTTEFKAENGNFIIDAHFVAMTYAPLTDLLFRYIVNFPLINKNISTNPHTLAPPTNTYELILKVKNLYSSWSEKQKSNLDIIAYQNIIKEINNIDTLLINLGNLKNVDELKRNAIPLYLSCKFKMPFYEYNTSSVAEITPIDSIGSYVKDNIQSSPDEGISINTTTRLIFGYSVSNDIPNDKANALPPVGGQNTTTTTTNILSDTISPNTAYYKDLNLKLMDFKNNLLITAGLNTTGFIIKSDIADPTTFNGFDNNGVKNKYVGLDLTKYYDKLYKRKVKLLNDKVLAATKINSIINNMIHEDLGMRPTIYNIFKVILDDVDTFFNILKDCSVKAENHHNVPAYKTIITGNVSEYKDVPDKVYSFPLIVKVESLHNQKRETKIAPIELSAKFTEPFPEIYLIQQFIDTFVKQRNISEALNKRASKNADGTNVWLPITPLDSVLGTDNTASPYMGIDAASDSPDDKIKQMFRIILKRFYILTQNVLPYKIYDNANGNASDYITLYANEEAINLVGEINSLGLQSALKRNASIYGVPSSFYSYIEKAMPDLYNFTENQQPYFNLNFESTDGSNVYTDKTNPNFQGLKIEPMEISTQILPTDTEKKSTDSPIQAFYKKYIPGFFTKFIKDYKVENSLEFTNQNIPYIRDGKPSGADSNLGLNTATRFLIPPLYTDGTTIPSVYDAQFQDIVTIWTDQLAKHDTEIFPVVINYMDTSTYDEEISALVLASSFGAVLSPFSTLGENVSRIFVTPAAVDTPAFLGYYLGSLVGVIPGTPRYIKIYNYFNTGAGSKLSSQGRLILKDAENVNNDLAPADKATLKNIYDKAYISGNYKGIVMSLYNLYDTVNNYNNEVKKAIVDYNGGVDSLITLDELIAIKRKVYETELSSNSQTYYSGVLQPFMTKYILLNYSQMTFKIGVTKQIGYDSIASTRSDPKKGTYNDDYFRQFFGFVTELLRNKENELTDKENEQNKLNGDKDIITQTYYSFKNINDKWVTSPKTDSKVAGYPFCETGHLIDSFAFVDRAMNPIGDTIINPEILIDLLDDQNVSVFSVLSQLLSMNGFEFFPIQNFMSYTPDDWKQSFMIDTSGTVKTSNSFVCMYIGGGSSYPTGIQSIGVKGQFLDDGADNINTLPDFSTGISTYNPEDDKQIEKNKAFNYSQVRAFKVKFGQQNQSMFSNIKIDSKEYPETNESIKILSRLAGDNKLQAPVPKGQNLYNLYENRSYKATISGLGNMMIQPTQYFQLENVPLFSGAYIILGVEHSIEPNKMITNFNGMKILKYPVPRVLQASSILGFDGGNSEDTDLYSSQDYSEGPNAGADMSQAQYNSMYYFKIQ